MIALNITGIIIERRGRPLNLICLRVLAVRAARRVARVPKTISHMP
jgi:hypothetical protein